MRPTYLLTACLSLFLACQKPEQPPASKTEVPNVIEDTTGDNMLIGTWLRDGGVYGIVDSSGDTVYVDDTQNWLQCVWDDEFTFAANKRHYVNYNKDTCYNHFVDIDSFSTWELLENNTKLRYTDTRDGSKFMVRLDSFTTRSFVMVYDSVQHWFKGFEHRYRYKRK